MPEENPNQTPATSSEDRMLDTLDSIVKSVTSPDIVEAQTILLRRLALQGDVIASRIPSPRNITEIGGYLNLLDTLDQTEMRAQMLAGILGVAGPNPPLGWVSIKPLLALVSMPNDRPDCTAQASIPLTFSVRSDFLNYLKEALKSLHDQGCVLPLIAWALPLPQAVPGVEEPVDFLPYLGRTLDIVPASALRDPVTDPVALGRAKGSADAFQIVARVISPGPVAVPPSNWEVLKCDAAACTPMPIDSAQFVPVAPELATAGFYPSSPLPQPGRQTETSWAHFTNITGLVTGVTRLGDELALLYSPADISGSIFATRLHWVWDGTKFVSD
jgi:hypothetical protein